MNVPLLLLAALVAQDVEPPSTDEVIQQYVEALGGEMILQDLKNDIMIEPASTN